MKIISIGFKNPFHESGYTNTIKINNLDDINVFIGRNNSGIFRRLKVKLDHEDSNLILEGFYKEIYEIYQIRAKIRRFNSLLTVFVYQLKMKFNSI